jgi:hypothetical protein
MPVVLVHQGPTLTQEKYDEIATKVWGGKSKPDSVGDWPVDGLLVHAAGQGPNGFRVVDVWESEEAARRFGEKLQPILAEGGVNEEPEVYEAHTFVSA